VARRGYRNPYRRARAVVLADQPLCSYCGRLADTVDHVPPLASAPDPDLWEGQLVPACRECNLHRGGEYGAAKRWGKVPPPPTRAW